MFTIANPRIEFKEIAVKNVGVKFQGHWLRPCIGLAYWWRWGKYVFDTRPLRKHLGLPAEEFQTLNCHAMGKEGFEIRAKELITAVGEQSFFTLNATVNDIIEKGRKNTNPEDELPF